MTRMKKSVLALVFGLCLAGLTGCGKVTMENFQKLKPGITNDNVEEILGKPDACMSALGTRTCRWGDENGKQIQVVFLGDVVIGYSQKGLK